MTKEELKEYIEEQVYENDSQDISGDGLQDVLLKITDFIVDSLGSGYLFAGVATPTTNPGTPAQKVFYIAGPGTYQYFGTSRTIAQGNIGVFIYSSGWSLQSFSISLKKFVTSIACTADISQEVTHNLYTTDISVFLYKDKGNNYWEFCGDGSMYKVVVQDKINFYPADTATYKLIFVKL